MKIWTGYGSEHSSNLVMIGEFKDEGTAKSVLETIDKLTDRAMADNDAGLFEYDGDPDRRFSKDTLDFLMEANLAYIGTPDIEQLIYDHRFERDGTKVIMKTDEADVGCVLKLLVHEGAKVEVYSAHMHKSDHGRQTFTGEDDRDKGDGDEDAGDAA